MLRVQVNGREVSNPLVRWFAALAIVACLFLLLTLVTLVILPIIGVALGIGLGLGLAGGAAVLIGAPIALLRARRALRLTQHRELDD